MPFEYAAMAVEAYSAYEGTQSAGQQSSQATAAGQRADPFGPYRTQYANQLSDLMANPGDQLSKTPGYMAGLDAVQRSMGAQGYQGSGNMMAALSQYGGQAYSSQAEMLSKLAGAQFDPANGAKIDMAGQSEAAATRNAAMGQWGGVINNGANILGGIMNGGGSSSGTFGGGWGSSNDIYIT